MIDPALRNTNRLFPISFKVGRNLPVKNSFERHYMPILEIKDFIELIYNKRFLEQLM